MNVFKAILKTSFLFRVAYRTLDLTVYQEFFQQLQVNPDVRCLRFEAPISKTYLSRSRFLRKHVPIQVPSVLAHFESSLNNVKSVKVFFHVFGYLRFSCIKNATKRASQLILLNTFFKLDDLPPCPCDYLTYRATNKLSFVKIIKSKP
jgi:hypothetical protein